MTWRGNGMDYGKVARNLARNRSLSYRVMSVCWQISTLPFSTLMSFTASRDWYTWYTWRGTYQKGVPASKYLL
jgi:hypothetical protein